MYPLPAAPLAVGVGVDGRAEAESTDERGWIRGRVDERDAKTCSVVALSGRTELSSLSEA